MGNIVVQRLISSLALVSLIAAPLGADAQPAAKATATITVPPLPPVPNVAPGYAAPTASPNPPHVVGVTEQPFVGITLQNAIGMALMKNPNLAVSSADARIAAYRIQEARGAFDVRFNVAPSVTQSTAAPLNPFFAGPNYTPIQQNQQQVAAGVSGQLPAGTQYSLKVGNARVSSNSIFNGFDPYYTPTLSFDITQPLLKNAGQNAARNAVELAIIGNDATRAQTLATVLQTIAQVQDAYWDLVAAWRNVAIQEEALHESVLQYGSTQRMAKQGAAADVDVVESQGQVATFQDDVYSALQNVSMLQNQLKSLIVDDPADPIWQANLVPTSPVLQLPPAPTLTALVGQAMAQRPEVRQAEDMQKEAAQNVKFAHNQTLPQIDLKLGYANNSWAGTPANGATFSAFTGGAPPVTPAYLVGGNAQAWNNLWANKFPTYSAGIVFTTPLGNNTAKAQFRIAQQEQRQAAIARSGVAQRIVAESRNALQMYESALSRLQASRVAASTAAAVSASEQRKFKNGASTTFLVLQREVELSQARGRELHAQTDLNKAVVELQRVSGDSLRANDVKLSILGSQAKGAATP